MNFTCYRRPGRVVLLDDEPGYLEMLGEVLPPEWQLDLYDHPVDCLEAVATLEQDVEADIWAHREMAAGLRAGISPVATLLQYWRDDGTRRYGLPRVWVVDYSMPTMSGLEALRHLPNLPVLRVLLTGRADDHIAVMSFNAAEIDRFIAKQAQDIAAQLTGAIAAAQREGPTAIAQLWRQNLSRQQQSCINDPQVAIALEALVAEAGWVEYVLVGQPFGMLGLDSAGQAYWAQLEMPCGLADLAELAATQAIAAETVNEIRAGRVLFDGEFRMALAHRDGTGTILPARRLGGDNTLLYCTVQPLGDGASPGAPSSLATHRRQQPPRAIQSGRLD